MSVDPAKWWGGGAIEMVVVSHLVLSIFSPFLLTRHIVLG